MTEGVLCETSVDRRFGTGREERGGMPCERVVILKQRPVAGVRIREEYGVRQVLSQTVRVDNRNHLVVHAVDDKRRMLDGSEIRETLSGKAFPLAKRRDLGSR